LKKVPSLLGDWEDNFGLRGFELTSPLSPMKKAAEERTLRDGHQDDDRTRRGLHRFGGTTPNPGLGEVLSATGLIDFPLR
jgi:hypothetical protein